LVADVVAVHAFEAELHSLVTTIRDIWRSAAAGELPLAVAEWLTNIAQSHLETWEYLQPIERRSVERLMSSGWLPKVRVRLQEQNNIAICSVDEADVETLRGDGFLEFTHGKGFLWPCLEVKKFEEALETDDKPVTVERRKSEDYFPTLSEEHALGHTYVDSILEYCRTGEAATIEKHCRWGDDLEAKHYEADRVLMRKVFATIEQQPYWEPCTRWLDRGFDPLMEEGFLRFPDGMLLLLQAKERRETPTSDVMISCVVAVHFFLESCRCFILEHSFTTSNCRPNNRIKVLAFANTTRRAIQNLLATDNGDKSQ
jgi:hypothetical protein